MTHLVHSHDQEHINHHSFMHITPIKEVEHINT